MSFEWDSLKAGMNLAKHGISFAVAGECFFLPGVNVADDRKDYGEIRINRYGRLHDGTAVVVTFTSRANLIRIISARPANARERHLIP